MNTSHPLDGLHVIELSERGGAAFAGKTLHRLGAHVTKIEGPEGDPLRRRFSFARSEGEQTTTAAFDYFNEGKESRTVTPAELPDVIAGADAFILDLELARYEHWGLEVERLSSLDTRVVCAISPFGLTGPYSSYRGPEMVTSAFGGMSTGIGEPNRPPLKAPLMQTAIQAGLASSIVIMGTVAVGASDGDASGPGATVFDISETDVWATIHAGTSMISFIFANRARKRAGRRVLGLPYPHQLFQCKDGWIAIEPGRRRRYDDFIEMVGSPDWALERRFGSRLTMNNEHADEVDELLAPWFMARTRDEIFQECMKRNIPAAPVQSIGEVREDPALVDRGCFETYEGALGDEVRVPAPPYRFKNADLKAPGPVPSRQG